MRPQHLSDEAVAAFADGVLTGHARDRASKHTAECAECAAAVKGQRDAAFALRAAVAPPLPTGLFDRLRALPQVTPITMPPTVLADDGSPMISTFAPMAALVPSTVESPAGRRHTLLAATAAVAIAGALTTGVLLADSSQGDNPVPTGPSQQRVVPLTTMFTGPGR